MSRQSAHGPTEAWPDPPPNPFEHDQPQPPPYAKDTTVAVSLTSPPQRERRPRKTWVPPTLFHLSRRATVVITVVMALVITGLTTFLTWPRPPQLTDSQYLTMLVDTPAFHYATLAGSSYTVNGLAKDVVGLPDLLSTTLERSADAARDQYLNADYGRPDCVNSTDLQNSLIYLHASALTPISQSDSDANLVANLHLFDTARHANDAARPLAECDLAWMTTVPATYESGASVVIEQPVTPIPTTEAGATVWQARYTITLDHWIDTDESGIQTQHNETLSATNNITILTYGNVLAEIWDGGSSAGRTFGVPTIIAAIKDAQT